MLVISTGSYYDARIHEYQIKKKKVNIHIDALPALLPGGTLLPTEYEVGWFSETLQTYLKIKKSLTSTRARSTDRPASSVNASQLSYPDSYSKQPRLQMKENSNSRKEIAGRYLLR